MKRYLLLSFLVFTSFAIKAQIVFNPDSITVNASSDSTEIVAAFEVTNSYSSTVSFWWKLVKSDEFPEEWVTQVCDNNTCYFEDIDKCPKNNPNVMDSGVTSSNFSVKIKPHNIEANTLMYYNVYSDSDCTNQIASLPLNVSIGAVSVDKDIIHSKLTVFPNPTTDKFMLSHSEGIAKLEIYNIAGKLMKSYRVSKSKEYLVSDLRNGLYLVRFLDEQDRVSRVMRLSKK